MPAFHTDARSHGWKGADHVAKAGFSRVTRQTRSRVLVGLVTPYRLGAPAWTGVGCEPGGRSGACARPAGGGRAGFGDGACWFSGTAGQAGAGRAGGVRRDAEQCTGRVRPGGCALRRAGAPAGGCTGEGAGRRHGRWDLLPGLPTAAQLRAGQRPALGGVRQGAAGPGRPGGAANDRGRDDTPGGGRGRGRAGDAGAWDRATGDRGRAGGDHAGPSGAGDAEPGVDAGDQRLHGAAQRRGAGDDWRLAVHDHQPLHLQRHADPEGRPVCRRAHASPGAGRRVPRLGQFRHAVDLSQCDRPAHGHNEPQRHLHHRRAPGQPALQWPGLWCGRQR